VVINNRIASFLDKDTDERQAIWDDALKQFHQKKYAESIKTIARYLDPEVKFKNEDDKIKFELKQGSVTLFCRITESTFYAYINVLKIDYHDPIVYRRLLNLNATEFQNTKASIHKDFIRLHSESLLELASPSRLYWDLHELSTNGDKLDDVLSIYSKGVSETKQSETIAWPKEKVDLHFTFYTEWLSQALEKSDTWYRRNDLYVASWWLLGRIYSIMYFVQPEGKLYEEFNEIIADYHNEDRTHDENIKRVIIRVKKLKNMSKEEVVKNFYNTRYIFQIQKPITRNMLIKYLDAAMTSADRFKTLGHRESEYIALIYGLGMIINNFVADDEFLKDIIEVYEMAHVDYMVLEDEHAVRKYYKTTDYTFLRSLKGRFESRHIPYTVSDDKDLDVIIKRLRRFYNSILDGEI
jgi:hypothetical protein